MDVLGIVLAPNEVNTNAEANVQLKLPEKSEILSNATDEIASLAKKDTGKLILMVGISGMILAIIISVALHFLIK